MYLEREEQDSEMSFLEFLRTHKTSGSEAKRYASGDKALVGVKYFSYFNPQYFFQHCLMTIPFTSLDIFRSEELAIYGDKFAPFAMALRLNEKFWSNDDNVMRLLLSESNKQHFARDFVSYTHALRDTVHMIANGIIKRDDVDSGSSSNYVLHNLNASQIRPFLHVKSRIDQSMMMYSNSQPRVLPNSVDEGYETPDEYDLDDSFIDDSDVTESDSENESHQSSGHQYATPDSQVPIQPDVQFTPVDDLPMENRNPFVAIKGQAGSGKSFLLNTILNYCETKRCRVVLACPSAKLASRYRFLHPNITCETVHTLFAISVSDPPTYSINWSLASVHVIIVDEISQVNDTILNHIMYTRNSLPFKPTLIFAGDGSQLQPLKTVQNKTVNTKCFFELNDVNSHFTTYLLTHQMRCDDDYVDFLQKFRLNTPSVKDVEIINKNALCPMTDREVTVNKIEAVLKKFPDTTFLCLTMQCCDIVNRMATFVLFEHKSSVMTISDYQLNNLDIYLGQMLMITENRCKSTNYVNGTVGRFKFFEHETLYLEVDKSIVPVFPVYKESGVKYYPITPGYAYTVHKMQGQTLKHVTLVFKQTFANPGVGYVALSRVKSLSQVVPLLSLYREHFIPISSRRRTISL